MKNPGVSLTEELNKKGEKRWVAKIKGKGFLNKKIYFEPGLTRQEVLIKLSKLTKHI